MKFTRFDQREKPSSPAGKNTIQPTPIARRWIKLSWEDVVEVRRLFANGQGISVPEIRRNHFPYVSDVWLYAIVHGEVRQSPNPNYNRPYFINDTSQFPANSPYLRSPDGALWLRRNRGQCRIVPRIPDETIIAIRQRYRQGQSIGEIAVETGVSRDHVTRIIQRKTRKELP
jgi:hypothetical protein